MHIDVLAALAVALLLAGCGPLSANDGRGDRERLDAQLAEALPVDDFALYDHQGSLHQLTRYADASAVVLFVQGNACPIVRNSLAAFEAVRKRYEDRGVVFLMVNANVQDTRESIAEEAAAFGIDVPILVDEAQLVAAQLGVERTAEAYVIDPVLWRVVYRGPLDDRLSYEVQKAEASRHYLSEALDAYLSGEVPELRPPQVKGCLVAYPDRDAEGETPSITYTDVAPILVSSCQPCHRPGGIGPWAMTEYDVVRGWAPMMREVLRTKRMPPWQADPHVGSFSNDLSLTTEEVQTLVRWIEAGAPRGEATADPLAEALASDQAAAPPASPADALTTPAQALAAATRDAWPLGEPDLVIQGRPQRIPATGPIEYRYDTLRVPFDRDVWVQAVHLRPTNPAVLHHAFAFRSSPLDGPRWDQRRWINGVFVIYVPGMQGEAFPIGTGRRIPAGSEFYLQLHYTPTGREETDTPELALYFADAPPAREMKIAGAFVQRLDIPPGDPDHEVVARHTFEEDVTLYKMSPHMHYRGSRIRYEAHYPDGTTELLLSVPRYDFNWQRYYVLETPKRLPAGTTIVCRGAFDNSALNPSNPDPEQRVRWGIQTTDEMFIGYLVYTEAGEPDAPEQQAALQREGPAAPPR